MKLGYLQAKCQGLHTIPCHAFLAPIQTELKLADTAVLCLNDGEIRYGR